VLRPKNLFEKSYFHPLTFWYVARSIVKRRDPSWHYRDAENFSEIRARTHDALTYIETFKEKEESIVVVSHTVFINLIVAYMCNNNTLSFFNLLRSLTKVAKMKNGGVVHLKYYGGVGEFICKWQLVDCKE
jgi:broad specificity phosphatase PhoE